MANVGDLSVRIFLDSQGFQEGISKLGTEMRKLQSEFKLASAQLGQHGSELDKLRLKSEHMTKETELQRQRVQTLEEAHRKAVETKGADARVTQELEIRLNQARTRLVTMEQNLKDVNNQLTLQSSSWGKLGTSLQAAGEKLQAVGKKMQAAGKELSTKVTAPLVGLGALAAKASIDLETAFTGVIKTVDATEQELQELKQGFETMAKTVPIATTELYGIGEAAGQLGIKKENILGFSDVMAKLGVTTNMSSDQAATALARLANITQMPQTEFDRLGATIVALGNNLATTEAEIVEMGLRIAGAGSQIGLTEAQILSFAGALSSVGIEAESGGSAISRVMVDMANAVASGGQKLEQFAQVSGMSAAQFQQAFEKDAAGAIISFIEGLDKTAKRGGNVFAVLEDLGLSEIRVRDALLRAAGAGDLFRESLELGSEAWVENNALNKEAELRFETTASKIQLFKNQLQLTASAFGDALLPVMSKALEGITPLVQRFSELSDGTKTTILVIAGLAAAIGPVLLIGGKLVGVIGSVAGVLSTVSGAIAVATTGAVAATPAIGALATAFTVLTGPVGIAVAAIAGLTVAGVALYKHLSQESIPAIELFGKEVSEATQEAVGGFLDLNDQATLALNQLAWSGQEVTKEMADNIAGNFAQMASQVQSGLDKHHEESLAKIQGFVTSSTSLSQQEQDEILNNMQQGYENRKLAVAESEARIKEILDTASSEKRALTKSEQEEINAIQRQMVDTGIQVLSENEIEAKAIMERMKVQAGEISAKQAAEVVKNSIEQKDGAIKAANEQYNEVIKEIVRQRDEAGTISQEQADKLITEATRQKDESIAKAEEMHRRVVEEAQAQAQEHVNQVDWETGEIKTKWQAMKDDIFAKAKAIKENVSQTWEEIKKDSAEKWESTRATMSDKWDSIKTNTAETVASIKTNVSTTWDEVKTKTFETWDNIKTKTADTWLAIQNKIDEHGGGIKGLIGAYTEGYKSVWDSALTTMKEVTGEKFSAMADKVSESLDRVKNAISDAIDRIKEWNGTSVKEKVFSIVERITQVISTVTSGGGSDDNYSGTSFFSGGLTMVGELGPELVALPRGSRIYNDQETKQILGGSRGITQNITISSPTPLTPAETARQIKNASRQLALEW
jgi:TP901 family phage tail tape measure protein